MPRALGSSKLTRILFKFLSLITPYLAKPKPDLIEFTNSNSLQINTLVSSLFMPY